MQQRVYRLLQLVGRKDQPGLLPVSAATIWRWARDKAHPFPKPFKLGVHTTVWDAEQVEKFIATQREGRYESK